jgi:hypothetical protein
MLKLQLAVFDGGLLQGKNSAATLIETPLERSSLLGQFKPAVACAALFRRRDSNVPTAKKRIVTRGDRGHAWHSERH